MYRMLLALALMFCASIAANAACAWPHNGNFDNRSSLVISIRGSRTSSEPCTDTISAVSPGKRSHLYDTDWAYCPYNSRGCANWLYPYNTFQYTWRGPGATYKISGLSTALAQNISCSTRGGPGGGGVCIVFAYGNWY